jgi:hypothetical protein
MLDAKTIGHVTITCEVVQSELRGSECCLLLGRYHDELRSLRVGEWRNDELRSQSISCHLCVVAHTTHNT